MKRVVILGAGFAGLELATRLSEMKQPPCNQCTTIGNSEMKRMMRFDPAALTDAFRLIGYGRDRAAGARPS